MLKRIENVPTMLLAADSLAPKNSGIGRVARLMARFLSDSLSVERWSSVSFADTSVFRWGNERSYSAAGSRLRYVWQVQRYGWTSDWVLYDSLSMARAHRLGLTAFRPSIAWMHGIDVWEGARMDHLGVARKVTCLLTNSHYTKARATALHSGLDGAKVCWLGTETDSIPDIETRASEPTVLLLARVDVDSYKGYSDLLGIWPQVRQQVPNARLLFAGGGEGLGALREKVRNSGASGVEIRGFVDEKDIPDLWASADVFAMPSRGEGFGLVYIEAMRHGIPVVASQHDAGNEINLDRVTGFNVDLNRPADLADVLVTLLRDPVRARAMGEAGRRRWMEQFSYSAFRRRFESILMEEAVFANLAPVHGSSTGE